MYVLLDFKMEFFGMPQCGGMVLPILTKEPIMVAHLPRDYDSDKMKKIINADSNDTYRVYMSCKDISEASFNEKLALYAAHCNTADYMEQVLSRLGAFMESENENIDDFMALHIDDTVTLMRSYIGLPQPSNKDVRFSNPNHTSLYPNGITLFPPGVVAAFFHKVKGPTLAGTVVGAAYGAVASIESEDLRWLAVVIAAVMGGCIFLLAATLALMEESIATNEANENRAFNAN